MLRSATLSSIVKPKVNACSRHSIAWLSAWLTDARRFFKIRETGFGYFNRKIKACL